MREQLVSAHHLCEQRLRLGLEIALWRVLRMHAVEADVRLVSCRVLTLEEEVREIP